MNPVREGGSGFGRRFASRGAAYGPVALAALLVAAALLAPYRSQSFERPDGVMVEVPRLDRVTHVSDVWDYLQLGRRVYRGDGFTTLCTYVPFLPASGGGPPFPLFWRQPVYPVLVAGAFALAGRPSPDAFLVLQGLSVLALGWGTLLLARRLVPPGWAVLAALWALASPLALGVHEPLVTTTLFAGLVPVLVWCLLAARSLPAILLTGALVGASYLFRQETALLLPGFVVLGILAAPAGGAARRAGEVALAGLAALVVVSPWLLRSLRMTGDPLFNAASLLFHDTETFPSWTASRTLAILEYTSWEFLRAQPDDVAVKSGLNLLRFGRDALLLPGFLLAPLFWLAILRPRLLPGGRVFVRGGLVLGGVLVVALAPMEYAPRFLAPLVPLAVIAAAGAAAAFAGGGHGLAVPGGARFWNRAGGGITVFLAGALTLSLGTRAAGKTGAVALGGLAAVLDEPAVAAALGEGVLLTDAPTVYAWVWDRPAVWAPVPADLAAVGRLLPGSAAVLTCAAGVGDGLEPGLADAYRAGTAAEVTPGSGPCPAAFLLREPARPVEGAP